MNAYMSSHTTIQFRLKVALKWSVKKVVWSLCTSNSDDFVEIKRINYQIGEPKRKPKCVADFNALMGAVDKIHMILGSLDCVRKITKWYKKYFFLAIYNAYILYISANNKTGTFENFHPLLVKDILQKYHHAEWMLKEEEFIRTTFHFG